MKQLIESAKALLVFLIPSLIVGFAIGSYPGYKAYEYVWKDAGFCISCHVHDYATVGWHKSIHGQTTTCHDCHHQPLHAYIHETIVMIRDRPKFPKDLHHTPYVKKDLCAACHLSHPEDTSSITGPMKDRDIAKIPKVDTSVLHRIHLAKTTDLTLLNLMEIPDAQRTTNPEPITALPREKGPTRPIVCADCHGGPTNRGHNFSAVDLSCVRCHEQAHATKVVKEFGCRTCHFHEFLAPVVDRSPPWRK